MNKVLKREAKGITLVALVITIIILLILAGVALCLVIGENGLIIKSKEGIETYREKAEREEEQLTSFDDEFKKEIENDSGKKVEEIFDENGKDENDTGYNQNKLHIGDFVNYDAGTWTIDEISAIKTGERGNEISANNNSEFASNETFQFGGFTAGQSRNGNASTSHLNYTVEQKITGWRVFDIKEDGTVTLISAGCPETYTHTYGCTNEVYQSEYILSGVVDADATNLNLDSTYTKREWNEYINTNQKAIKATSITKARLDEWYNKYMNVTNADTWETEIFRNVYGTRYETLIDNYISYWLPAVKNSSLGMLNSGPESIDKSREVTINDVNVRKIANGVRVLVDLSSDVKFSSEKVGTTTLKDPRNAEKSWIYNVWDIK